MKPSVALSALTLLASPLLGLTPANAADPEPGVSVTWPQVTEFNPTQVAYEATVTNNGDGYLFSSWSDPDQSVYDLDPAPVPESGIVTLAAGQEGRGTVRIWSCTTDQWLTDGSCIEVATSPVLEVWSRIWLGDHQGTPQRRGAGENHTRFYYAPQAPTVNSPTGTWELLDTDKTPFATPVTGTLTADDLAINPDDGLSRLGFDIPADLPSGNYYLDVRMTVDTDEFGPLQGSFGADDNLIDVVVDTDAPELTVGKYEPTVYPLRDDYLDAIQIKATSNEATTGTLEVTNKTGARVYRATHLRIAEELWWPDAIHWDGRTSADKVVPAGTYTLTLTAADSAGNTDTWSGKVAVSHKKLQWTLFKRTVTAAESRAGKPLVGRCSTLASPANGGPRGSLGFYSQSKCKGNNDASVVASNHGMYIPKAHKNRYDWAQVTLTGGPATGSRSNYMVMGYVGTRGTQLINSRVFRRGTGAHAGMRLPLGVGNVFDRNSDRPYVIWSNGLTAGSRYNVRSYTVQVRYLAVK